MKSRKTRTGFYSLKVAGINIDDDDNFLMCVIIHEHVFVMGFDSNDQSTAVPS